MKKTTVFRNLLALAVAATMSVGFTSCSEDDEVFVDKSTVEFSEKGGVQSIQVTSNIDWTVSGSPSWLTVSPTMGTDNGTFTITASANTGEARNCTLYIMGGDAQTTVSVNQNGKSAITVKNNSTYTLPRFTIHFVNDRFDELSTRDFGTLYPGGTATAEIATGATEYYMATNLYGTWYFSANYSIDYTNMSLTTSEIDNWRANPTN